MMPKGVEHGRTGEQLARVAVKIFVANFPKRTLCKSAPVSPEYAKDETLSDCADTEWLLAN